MELEQKKKKRKTAKTLGRSLGGHSNHWLAAAKETSKMAPTVLSSVTDDATERTGKIRSSRDEFRLSQPLSQKC